MKQEETKVVYIATLKGDEILYYDFTCPECKESAILATGIGRYGNLGAFNCPHCEQSFYATNDDFPRAWLYVDRPTRNIVLPPLSKGELQK